MEMKYVVPYLAQSFGTLEFAGESEPIFERDKNNRRVLARRSYNLYSDVQKGENVVVEIPVQAGEKKFKYEQKVKLVNPKLYGRGYAIGDMVLSCKLDAPAPCRLDAPDFSFVCHVLADCLHQH